MTGYKPTRLPTRVMEKRGEEDDDRPEAASRPDEGLDVPIALRLLGRLLAAPVSAAVQANAIELAI